MLRTSGIMFHGKVVHFISSGAGCIRMGSKRNVVRATFAGFICG